MYLNKYAIKENIVFKEYIYVLSTNYSKNIALHSYFMDIILRSTNFN